MTQKTALLWFRQDLRLEDNPALNYAATNGYKIIPIYILDDVNAGDHKMGGASRWWLHESLTSLNKDLREHMVFRAGDAAKIIPELIKETGADAIFWNRCYEPWRIKRDKAIKESLEIEVQSFNASLLWEPWTVAKDDGTPYKVFTPYYKRGCLKIEPPEPQARLERITYADHTAKLGTPDDLGLMPKIKWYEEMASLWKPGEAGAQERLTDFLDEGLKGYKDGRNIPSRPHVSKLSPHLHFGEISVRQVWHDIKAYAAQHHIEQDAEVYCSELGWREFSYYQLYHFPSLPWENLQQRFNAFPWNAQDSNDLEAWRRGRTGIPIVDAGMRELWRTGWMHNRVRMIVASLLVKNMLTHWHRGEDWFWDCLVDADLASNSASWQWVAGSGADAAPYFRIFNPVTQGERFDPDGSYVRQFVPELRDVPDKYIHAPWKMASPPKDYPAPIVDLKKSREAALEAFAQTKGA